MRTSTYVCLLILAAMLTFSSTAQESAAAPIAADDFLAPIQAQSEEEKLATTQIQAPQEVKQEEGLDGKAVTSAATAQDAINATANELASIGGCEQIKFPSGFGWVAVGTDVYSIMPNKTATLAAQRLAYQKAYLKAKKSLAEALYGLSSTAQEQLKQNIKTILTDNAALANISENISESITEQVQGLLKGYVVYSVNDAQEQEHGTVTVTIVTTPKTMGKTTRIAPSSISTESVRDGLNHVLAELASGLMPPVGGKTVSVPQTGELAFIGFGSAIIQENSNPAAQAKLALNAQKIAAMRARSALCGIILGDDIQATSSLDSQTQTMNKQFEEMQQEDPVNKEQNQGQITTLEQQHNSFLTTELSKEQMSSLRSGVLPPGVRVKVFFTPEKTMAQAVAVYIPSLTGKAAATGKTMNSATILPTGQGGSTASGETALPSRGMSGQVMSDEDL